MPVNDSGDALARLAKAVESGDEAAAAELTVTLLAEGMDWKTILDDALLPGINRVCEQFDTLEAFLPDLIFGARAIKTCLAKISGTLAEEEQRSFKKGTVVIGTVKGDIHDVGKTIVATLLEANGFEVYDLGVDVSSEMFVARAQEVDADIICLSSLMTTALARQKEVLEDLQRLGMMERYIVLVGGGAVTESWAREIGAHGFGEDAAKAVELALQLSSQRSRE